MLKSVRNELSFVMHMTRLNLASNMEYRASFLSQIFGMMINNGIYFIFWLLFFDRFQEIKGYQIDEIYMLFAVITLGFGIAYTFAGNASSIPQLIANGRLDYYLALPRPVLLHVLFSRMGQSTIGDLTFGVVAFLFAGRLDPLSILLYIVSVLLVAVLFVSVAVIFGSLAFFLGHAQQLAQTMLNTLLTFSLYPFGLFSGVVRFVLLTIVPAAFIGAVPVQVIQANDPGALLLLVGAAAGSVVIMLTVFHLGLRRYESGNALNVNI